MAKHDVVAKVRALLARAVDPGAPVEEQRTSAHMAAKLCREHGIGIGELADAPQPARARLEVVIDGVRTVVETVNAGRSGLDAALGFDVFGFAQNLLRERAQQAITEAIKNPAPAVRKKRKR